MLTLSRLCSNRAHCPWSPNFALLVISYKSNARHPRFYGLQSTRLPSISLRAQPCISYNSTNGKSCLCCLLITTGTLLHLIFIHQGIEKRSVMSQKFIFVKLWDWLAYLERKRQKRSPCQKSSCKCKLVKRYKHLFALMTPYKIIGAHFPFISSPICTNRLIFGK